LRTELPPLDYTLWRNAVLLGRVRIAFPVRSAGLIAGMLEVESAFADIDEIMQTRSPIPRDAPVQETRRSEVQHGPGPVALRELTPEEARGIPRERLLEVRDRGGQVLATDLISIDRLPPQLTEQGELVEICAARGIRVSPWCLTAHVRDAHPGAS
jgi:hypothetical protein